MHTTGQQLQRFNIPQIDMLSSHVTVARDLDVTIDSQLLLSARVSALSRLCYFHL